MFRDNAFYGHASILRAYCGVKLPVPLPARLQHGWTTVTPGLVEAYLRAPYPKLVWARRNLSACRRLGYSVIPIGAPLLYMPPLEAEVAPAGPKSLLVFPYHRSELLAVEGSLDDYATSLETLVRDGFGPVTVCLHSLEYERPELRALFERRGFGVVCNGSLFDPRFLYRQRELILRHAHVSSNRVATAAFYALFLGRPYFLFGPRVGRASESGEAEHFAAWTAQEFPALLYERYDGTVQRAIGETELGLEFRLEPEVLRALLDWNWSSAPVHLVRLAQHLGHYLWRRITFAERP